MKAPKVTVLMPVYNGEKYLKDAIESIIGQDFTDFEFLIINDGSTDGSGTIMASYSDPRIHIVNNEKNIGLVNSLNKAMELAFGEYIVRMDCDDISLKNRLSVQVKFMDANQNFGASGSYYYLLRNGTKAIVDFPLKENEIKCFMIFNCPIAHPSAIIRNSLIKKYNLKYSSDYLHSEDYDLWSRMSEISGLSNLSDVLLKYRVHANQITGSTHLASTRYKSVNAIRSRHLKKMGVEPSEKEMLVHNLVSDGETPTSVEQFNEVEQWLKKLVLTNDKKLVLDTNYFQKIILERWIRVCFNYFQGVKGFRYFYRSELYSLTALTFRSKLELTRTVYYSWKRLKMKN